MLPAPDDLGDEGPTTIGNQPPWGILATLAAKKARSISRIGTVTVSARRRLHNHRSTSTRWKSSVVIAIVVVTAMP